ncbi:MAG: hypothetical protein DMG64_19345 [Acidobacteria bacterium]|nr:MAG: hypothetical protein DMG64_19345 [Acidobacteriota bacterium]PYY22154.1 MAG: hypothetical protein DMG62_14930 [Acidobacteriota bacterium]
MLLVILSAGVLAGLLLVIWIVRGGSKPLSGEHTGPTFYFVDSAAFRNLLSREEKDFLRGALRRSHYLKVRRARLRAMQEYLLWIAANCATLIALLRLRIADPERASAPETQGLVQNALRLRMISLGLWLLLWLEFLFPGVEIRPVAAARRYEEVWRSAESYFRTHLSEPAMFVREAAN